VSARPVAGEPEARIAPALAWNSWDSVYPAEFVHLPSGVRLAVAAYSAKRNGFTRFPPGESVRLGPRTIGLERASLELSHAGTELSLALAQEGEGPLVARWRTLRHGEWGLRFWLLLVFQWQPPAGGGDAIWRFDGRAAELAAAEGPWRARCRTEPAPLMATFHDGWDAIRSEFETEGYFFLGSRGVEGRFAALRFNLEENPTGRFELAVVRGGAAASASRLEPSPSAPSRARPQNALEAVRDVVAWNTVWDPVNRRRYTSLSRYWVAQKFGGWGVWLDDLFYHALMAAPFDLDLARDNLRAVLAGQQPAGNLPCLLTGNDAWVDRSQPPVCAFVVWLIYLRSGARDLLELAFPPLLANHDWWWRMRDGNGDGLLEYGSSSVGEGLYRRTKLAAKDESSMDNSPTHDETTFQAESGTLDCADVGLNSLVALDGEMLARMARELGDEATARRLDERAEGLRQRIAERLWDPERGVFANRLWSGRFVRSLAPTSFYPLLAGAARPEQAAAMLRLLSDPRKFGGTWLLPSVTRDDPAFPDNVYWRGRIWPPLNFLVWHGLRRAGYDAAASELADNGYRLFMGEWRHLRHSPENYGAVSGAAMDQPDTDPFYGWGALLPWLAVADRIDANPWGGLELRHDGENFEVGPLSFAGCSIGLAGRAGTLAVSLDGVPLFESDLQGRWQEIEIGGHGVAAMLPPVGAAGGWVEFRRPLRSVTLDGKPLAPQARLQFAASAAAQRLEVRFA